MLANSLDRAVSDPGPDAPSRRGLVRAGVWTAPAVILATAAPAAASTSFSTTMTGLLCLYPDNSPSYAVRTTPSGLRHDTVIWPGGVGIQLWNGTPGATVAQIMINISFTPDPSPTMTSDLVAEADRPAQLVFVAPTKAGDRVPGNLRYLYVPSSPAVYDATGSYSVTLGQQFAFGNAGLNQHGTYHLGLLVGGQAAMFYHWYV